MLKDIKSLTVLPKSVVNLNIENKLNAYGLLLRAVLIVKRLQTADKGGTSKERVETRNWNNYVFFDHFSHYCLAHYTFRMII